MLPNDNNCNSYNYSHISRERQGGVRGTRISRPDAVSCTGRYHSLINSCPAVTKRGMRGGRGPTPVAHRPGRPGALFAPRTSRGRHDKDTIVGLRWRESPCVAALSEAVSVSVSSIVLGPGLVILTYCPDSCCMSTRIYTSTDWRRGQQRFPPRPRVSFRSRHVKSPSQNQTSNFSIDVCQWEYLYASETSAPKQMMYRLESWIPSLIRRLEGSMAIAQLPRTRHYSTVQSVLVWRRASPFLAPIYWFPPFICR
ncbi:hypothetical protein J6590_004962 [Homalodisca vitripennis]|nr:hypothetical protein J6590_004962 [Homalodisca vitripennis]